MATKCGSWSLSFNSAETCFELQLSGFGRPFGMDYILMTIREVQKGSEQSWV